MPTVAKAFLFLLTIISFLLFILLWFSPFCLYKIDTAGGYVLCVSLFNKRLPPIFPRDTVGLSGSYNSFHDQNNYNLPRIVDEKDVVKLSEKNFSHIVSGNKHVMVAFYAPWCYWSKKMALDYVAAATELKGKVVLAQVDATKEIGLSNKFGIQAYPTLYFFVDGVHVDSYYSERKRDAIVNWIKTRIAGALYTLMTTEQAEHLLTAESTIVLGSLDSLEGLENEVLAAASKVHPNVTFYRTTSPDVAEIFHIDPEIKRPALVLLQKESKHLSHFDGPFTKSSIAEFVSVNKHPLMITFTSKSALLIFNSPMKQLWLFAEAHDSDVTSKFQEAAKAFKGKLLFVYVQMDSQTGGKQISDYLGITGHAPRVIAISGILSPNKWVLYGELTSWNIKSFALNFMEDKFWDEPNKISDTDLRLPLRQYD